MTAAFNLPGSVFVANLWWYAFNVLRPAQALKPLGLYAGRQMGRFPRASTQPGAGPHYSRLSREAVLLPAPPPGYAEVEDFDALSHTYDRVVEPFSQPLFEEVVRLMRPLATRQSRILDASCGPGSELLRLAEYVPDGEVVGIDLAAQMVTTASERARQRGLENVAFFQSDIAALPAHFEGRFDFVHCSCAFHHYPDALGAVSEMRRALRDGGHVFITDAGPWWMKLLASPLAKLGDPGWVQFRTGEEFAELFARAGYSNFYWTELLPGIGLSIGTK